MGTHTIFLFTTRVMTFYGMLDVLLAIPATPAWFCFIALRAGWGYIWYRSIKYSFYGDNTSDVNSRPIGNYDFHFYAWTKITFAMYVCRYMVVICALQGIIAATQSHRRDIRRPHLSPHQTIVTLNRLIFGKWSLVKIYI